MAVTMNAATFLGKNFQENQNSIMNTTDLTLKKMFDISTKLVSEQDEIFNVDTIHWEKHEFDLANLIQTKAQFSYAMTVVDRINGSHVEGRFEGDARQRERGRKTGGVHVDLIKNSYLQRTEKHRSLQGTEKEFNQGSYQLDLRMCAA